MTKEEIQAKVQQALLSVRNDLNESQLKADTSLITDLKFDSMTLVSMASELESAFDRSLPLPDWVSQAREQGLTIGSLVDFLYERLK